MTAVCPHCGGRVEVGTRGYVMLSCTPVLTRYMKRHQHTTVVRHTHGLGYPPTRP